MRSIKVALLLAILGCLSLCSCEQNSSPTANASSEVEAQALKSPAPPSEPLIVSVDRDLLLKELGLTISKTVSSTGSWRIGWFAHIQNDKDADGISFLTVAVCESPQIAEAIWERHFMHYEMGPPRPHLHRFDEGKHGDKSLIANSQGFILYKNAMVTLQWHGRYPADQIKKLDSLFSAPSKAVRIGKPLSMPRFKNLPDNLEIKRNTPITIIPEYTGIDKSQPPLSVSSQSKNFAHITEEGHLAFNIPDHTEYKSPIPVTIYAVGEGLVFFEKTIKLTVIE